MVIKMNKLSISPCNLCPRQCGAYRLRGQAGRCHADDRIFVARAALHMWEEPCISGERGSGAVFFAGCSLGCIYCQNHEIAAGGKGKQITVSRLAEIFMELQAQGAANINLVTPDHYVTGVAEAVLMAKAWGLTIPIVYNCSGYARREVIRSLSGIVDIFLTDFKYMDPALAAKYSAAPDYPAVAKEALREMVYITRLATSCGMIVNDRNVKKTANVRSENENTRIDDEVYINDNPAFDENGMMRRGVIVRHLLLPGHKQNAKDVIRYVYETYKDSVYISLMNQYTPFISLSKYPDCRELGRKVTKREYEAVVDYALELGVKNAFIQEGDTAKESFVPVFDGEGVY